jgi:hypothetical protein
MILNKEIHEGLVKASARESALKTIGRYATVLIDPSAAPTDIVAAGHIVGVFAAWSSSSTSGGVCLVVRVSHKGGTVEVELVDDDLVVRCHVCTELILQAVDHRCIVEAFLDEMNKELGLRRWDLHRVIHAGGTFVCREHRKDVNDG